MLLKFFFSYIYFFISYRVFLVLSFKVGILSLRILLYDFATIPTGRFSFLAIFKTWCLSKYLAHALLSNELWSPLQLAHLGLELQDWCECSSRQILHWVLLDLQFLETWPNFMHLVHCIGFSWYNLNGFGWPKRKIFPTIVERGKNKKGIRLYSPYRRCWSPFLGPSARKCNRDLGASHPVLSHTLPVYLPKISPGTHLELGRLWLSLQSHATDPRPKLRNWVHRDLNPRPLRQGIPNPAHQPIRPGRLLRVVK